MDIVESLATLIEDATCVVDSAVNETGGWVMVRLDALHDLSETIRTAQVELDVYRDLEAAMADRVRA